jgi:peptidoglycan/LPS O-acetylase OafA/YrhL
MENTEEKISIVTNAMMVKPELLPLTSLRFISAFWVFLFHINTRWSLDLPVPIDNIISQGPLGMSIFFVLSGFILTYTYFDKDPIRDYKNFLIKRFARIYPVYILISIITLPLLLIPQAATDTIGVIYHVLTYLLVVGLNVLLLQAWFPSLFSYWIDGGTWSLSVECFFYILFPYILLILKPLSLDRLKKLLLIFYVISLIPGLVFISPLIPKVSFATVYALPIYRLAEFVIGAIVAIIFITTRDRHHSYASDSYKLICLAIGLLTYLSIFAKAFPQIYVIHNFVAIPTIAAIVYYCASISKGYLYRILADRTFVLLGKISYSFYLVQLIPLLFIETNYQKIVHHLPFSSNNYLLAICIFVVTLLGSGVTYYAIENPFRKFIIKRI